MTRGGRKRGSGGGGGLSQPDTASQGGQQERWAQPRQPSHPPLAENDRRYDPNDPTGAFGGPYSFSEFQEWYGQQAQSTWAMATPAGVPQRPIGTNGTAAGSRSGAAASKPTSGLPKALGILSIPIPPQGGGEQPPRGKLTKEEKKDMRRAKQAETIAVKVEKEWEYWEECRREAARTSSKQGGKGPGEQQRREADQAAEERELFAAQGAQGINFDKYDSIQVEVSGAAAGLAPPLEAFSQLGAALPPFLARNVTLMRYERPTPIQKHAMPLALAGADLICCAQTGSGKTCAFLLPLTAVIQRAGPQVAGAECASPRAVVIGPTRELAAQIHLEARKLCCRSGLRAVVVYGGADQRKQVRELAFGCDIVVGTPGRLTDFLERGILSLRHISFLVLDEADRMLDMGFEPQVRRIVQRSDMPAKAGRQTLLFSATFAPEVQKLAREFLREGYVWIAVGRVGSAVEAVEQRLVRAAADKRAKLRQVAQALAATDGRTLVFVHKKKTASWLKKMLRAGGPADAPPDERFQPITAEDIHGDRSQAQREAALAAFREGKCRVLVATDVAARGLDIAAVTHVVNMDLPTSADDFDSFVHRVGRTGRAGHAGLATSLYVPGFEAKVGNGPVAKLLAAVLQDRGQELPPWFAALPEVAGGGGGSGPRGGGAKAMERDARPIHEKRIAAPPPPHPALARPLPTASPAAVQAQPSMPPQPAPGDQQPAGTADGKAKRNRGRGRRGGRGSGADRAQAATTN